MLVKGHATKSSKSWKNWNAQVKVREEMFSILQWYPTFQVFPPFLIYTEIVNSD